MDKDLIEILENAPKNKTIQNALAKSYEVLHNYHNIQVSVSGGSDSDIMLDLLIRTGNVNEMSFIFFETGVEYKATKEHLAYLEDRYGIKIKRVLPKKSVVVSCRQDGIPFWNKMVSMQLYGLQLHGFQFEDEPIEVLEQKYPGCKSYLKWWCNSYCDGRHSMYNINYISYLKEFLIQNPPDFKISKKCCDYAKKKVSKSFYRKNKSDLDCTGIRKDEGGVRSLAYKDCFTVEDDGVTVFRPIFWFTEEDKTEYEDFYDIQHSRCYTEYGFTRTGCAGCPFNLNWEEDVERIKEFEPSLYKACQNLFKKSYDYRTEFEKYRKDLKAKRIKPSC